MSFFHLLCHKENRSVIVCLLFQFSPPHFVSKTYPTRQPTTPRSCDFNPTTSSCVSLLLKYPPLRPPQPWTSCSHLFVQLRLLCTRTCMSSVLTVAAKFHRPALNSTSVALCYLTVISHVHFWLTKTEEVCVWVCVIGTLCKVKQKCEKWRWEKKRCIVSAVCC